ncbi:MAG: polyphenol oxidase family protein [Verrucomicrobiota bacterium]
MNWIHFPLLNRPELVHGFSKRSDSDLSLLNQDFDDSLKALGIKSEQTIQAEQTHGNGVAVVEKASFERVPQVDALVTSVRQLALVVRVADCGPVFFYDPIQKVIAVAHSGRKGTEQNIVAETLKVMQENQGCEIKNILVQLGPCIRPPHYEVAFAEEIGRQARAMGVSQFEDCGFCTGSDLKRFYSYRLEKGKTGRMWGVLMIK